MIPRLNRKVGCGGWRKSRDPSTPECCWGCVWRPCGAGQRESRQWGCRGSSLMRSRPARGSHSLVLLHQELLRSFASSLFPLSLTALSLSLPLSTKRAVLSLSLCIISLAPMRASKPPGCGFPPADTLLAPYTGEAREQGGLPCRVTQNSSSGLSASVAGVNLDPE